MSNATRHIWPYQVERYGCQNATPSAVGWVERSDTHRKTRCGIPLGIAALHPTYRRDAPRFPFQCLYRMTPATAAAAMRNGSGILKRHRMRTLASPMMAVGKSMIEPRARMTAAPAIAPDAAEPGRVGKGKKPCPRRTRWWATLRFCPPYVVSAFFNACSARGSTERSCSCPCRHSCN